MDPDVALDEILDLAGRLDEGGLEHTAVLADELATKIRTLDGWLMKGGFLPERWQRQRTAPAENIALTIAVAALRDQRVVLSNTANVAADAIDRLRGHR